MTLKTRRILLILFTIIFLIASTIIILYSTGWRFDIKTFSIKKTGAIYIETLPKYVSIKINGKNFLDDSGILKNGTLISNLMPKNYKIEIDKKDYYPYYKEIKLEPSLVSELIGIILIPTKFEEKNIISTKLKGEKIIDFANNKIIINNPKSKINYLYNLNDGESALNINSVLNNLIRATPKTSSEQEKSAIISKIVFHPLEKNKLLIEANNLIYVLDTEKLKIEEIGLQILSPLAPPTSESSVTNGKNQISKLENWIAKNSDIYYIVKKNNQKSKIESFQLFSFNLIAKTNIDFGSLEISGLKEIKILNNGNKLLIIDNSNNFYIFDLQTRKMEMISKNVLNIVSSLDSKKIAFLDKENKINIYFLENWYKNHPQKTGETIKLNTENNGEIKNIFWYKDSYHLFIEYENHCESVLSQCKSVSFTEIDLRDHLNQYPIIQEIKTAYYEAGSKILYFIKNEKLYSLEI